MCREGHGVHFTTVQDRDSPSGVRTKAQRRLQLVWAKQFDKRCGRKTLHIKTHEHGKNMQMAVSGSQLAAGDQEAARSRASTCEASAPRGHRQQKKGKTSWYVKTNPTEGPTGRK